MRRAAIPGLIMAFAVLAISPAQAAQSLFELCNTTIVKLKGAGIIQGLTSHGSNPRGFDLLVNQGKWRMIDPSTQSTIVHYAACFIAQGDNTIQTSGLVHDTETNKQLGAMSLSGQYFPAPTGPGFSP